MTAGTYLPTEVCDQGIADKLGIPATYLRRLREQLHRSAWAPVIGNRAPDVSRKCPPADGKAGACLYGGS